MIYKYWLQNSKFLLITSKIMRHKGDLSTEIFNFIKF
jgi:hypothetical protein